MFILVIQLTYSVQQLVSTKKALLIVTAKHSAPECIQRWLAWSQRTEQLQLFLEQQHKFQTNDNLTICYIWIGNCLLVSWQYYKIIMSYFLFTTRRISIFSIICIRFDNILVSNLFLAQQLANCKLCAAAAGLKTPVHDHVGFYGHFNSQRLYRGRYYNNLKTWDMGNTWWKNPTWQWVCFSRLWLLLL